MGSRRLRKSLIFVSRWVKNCDHLWSKIYAVNEFVICVQLKICDQMICDQMICDQMICDQMISDQLIIPDQLMICE